MIGLTLLPLLIFIGLVVLVVRAVSGRGGGGGEPAGTTIRRLFQYGLLFAVLIVVANGLTGLVAELLPAGGIELLRAEERIARSLTFLVVGGPVLAGLAWWTRGQIQADEAERRSFGWAFYLTAASFTALVAAAVSLFEAVSWMVGAESYDPDTVARAAVWTIVWAAHWWISERYGWEPRLRLERLAGSAVGLVFLAGGVAAALALILGSGYDRVFRAMVLEGISDELMQALAGAAIGGAVWWWYWLRRVAGAERDNWWHGYVLLVGVLAGLVTLITAGGIALYRALEWLVGDPIASTARTQFSSYPGLAASGMVGFSVWWYHRSVLREAVGGTRSEVSRVYDYLMAGSGLVAAVSGVTTVLVALIEALQPTVPVAGGSARNTLIAAVTLLAIGAPLWWVFWRRIQLLGEEKPNQELGSTTRRIYLFALFGVGGVIALTSMLGLVVAFFEDLIVGRVGALTVDEIRMPLSLVVTTGLVAWYHWGVYRHDRTVAPAPAKPKVRDVILVSADGEELAEEISRRLGVRVRHWHRLDLGAAEYDTGSMIDAIRSQPSEHVLVVAGTEGVEVVPYEEG